MKEKQIKAPMGGAGKTTMQKLGSKAKFDEFIRRGQAVQQAVDAAIAAERAKQKSWACVMVPVIFLMPGITSPVIGRQFENRLG